MEDSHTASFISLDILKSEQEAKVDTSCEDRLSIHHDVIKWKHFPRYWPFAWGIHWSPVNSPHKGQWRGALMFSLICTWINCWVNNREAGNLRCNCAHYDIIVMLMAFMLLRNNCCCWQQAPWRRFIMGIAGKTVFTVFEAGSDSSSKGMVSLEIQDKLMESFLYNFFPEQWFQSPSLRILQCGSTYPS